MVPLMQAQEWQLDQPRNRPTGRRGRPNRSTVGLRPKMYSMVYGALVDSEKHKATGKGIKKGYLKNNITHA
eukprot:SAG31_NODE_14239_length_819_cov_0.997222_1_plen_70_part_01